MKNILKALKEFQRPVRTVLWTILIAFAFIACLFNHCHETLLTEMILIAMFADMGIYTVARTFEKIKGKDTETKDNSIP